MTRVFILFSVVSTVAIADKFAREIDAERPYDDISRGDVVVRGPDWKWRDQDGGNGERGVVTDITRWTGESSPRKYAVRVRWDKSGLVNLYRYGAENKIDVRVIGKRSEPFVRWHSLDEDVSAGIDEFTTIENEEREILIKLYRDTSFGRGWISAEKWRFEENARPCEESWEGVVCESSRVIALDVSNNGLRGALPRELTGLVALRSLTVANNALTGSFAPRGDGLRMMTRLRFVAAHNNAMSGPLPSEMGSLTELEWLSMYNNAFTGTIPPEYGNLRKLSALYLQINRLTGHVPIELGKLSELRELSLHQNDLSGPVPSVVRLSLSQTKIRSDGSASSSRAARLSKDRKGVGDSHNRRGDEDTVLVADERDL